MDLLLEKLVSFLNKLKNYHLFVLLGLDRAHHKERVFLDRLLDGRLFALRFGSLLFFLLVLFTGLLHFGSFLLFSGVWVDDTQAQSPYVEATMDVIEIALLYDFSKLLEILF